MDNFADCRESPWDRVIAVDALYGMRIYCPNGKSTILYYFPIWSILISPFDNVCCVVEEQKTNNYGNDELAPL